MTEEDEEFNRIEREAAMRMEAVSAALDKKAENARELGLDYEPVWGGGLTNKDYEDAMRQRRLHQPTTPLARYSDIISDGGMDPRSKTIPTSDSIAKYVDALIAGTHAITSVTIRPKPTWKGLTDEEMLTLEETTTCTKDESWLRNLTRAIEAKLREKNT